MLKSGFLELIMVTAKEVKPRTYFLMELNTREVISGIRAGAILLGILALVLYVRMKKNHKSEE